MRNLLLGIMLTVASLPLTAGLTFESNTISTTADPAATKETVTFKFKNDGDRPVTIQEVKPSCGCTTTQLEKFTYEPGETGEISATLDIGRRVGHQTKSITVTTDDPAQSQIQLQLQVEIPELIKFSSMGLVWKIGAEAVPQTITATVTHSEAINIKEVKSNDETFTIQLEEVEAGKEYKITVTPVSTEARNIRTASVITDYPETNPKAYTLSFRVY